MRDSVSRSSPTTPYEDGQELGATYFIGGFLARFSAGVE